MATKSTTPGTGVRQPTQDQIAQRAREIWMRRGSPGGCDLEHWLDAERELRAEIDCRAETTPSTSAGSPSQRQDLDEAEKRLDGLIEEELSPARRTPAGEQL